MTGPAMKLKPSSAAAAALRRRAEASLRKPRSKTGPARPAAEAQRLLHELQVHQLELEMQNAELLEARDRLEAAVEKYTDLYDFAPVGYFSLDEQGRIREANLSGATLLGVERSRLLNRRFPRFVDPASRPVFEGFLAAVLAGPGRQACEAIVLKQDGSPFCAGFHGTSAPAASGLRSWCRVALSDITALRRAREAQGRVEALTVRNQELNREILRRQAVETALKHSEQHQGKLLEQSREMQEQLRRLSHQILSAQEEERKLISRELHDVIAQTLTGINIHLTRLKVEAATSPESLPENISSTQRLVEKSVSIVHQFARELRPPVLDDLGLIPALHTYMKSFTAQTGIRVSLTAYAAVERLNGDQRTVLYRVAQEALTNIARHAHATRAEVKLQKLPRHLCLKIQDNGRGFQAGRLVQARQHTRLGLLGMRERVQMVGGRLTIKSTPGKGTTILAQIPLNDPASAAHRPPKRNNR